ncbi:hypothetical protein TruAng_009051 [Truncatella angustata]|nr:hypothetical protein TruAng_009051 [Truncatella angustata]
MPPTTRLQHRSQRHESSTESEDSSDESTQADNCIRFPSKLIYTLEGLDKDKRRHAIDAIEDPSQIILQKCAAREKFVVFQVSELKHFDIRSGSKESRWETPSCSCQDGMTGQTPCRHILWLFDQITSQLFDIRDELLTLNDQGISNRLEDPYDMITRCHLNILADDLHIQSSGKVSDARDGPYNPRRVEEVREVLASLHRTPVDQYRPDIFTSPTGGTRPVKRNDLECTVFRMLCENNEFFHYFMSCMRNDELIHNPFRKLQKRADAVLAEHDAYAKSVSANSDDEEYPANVQWCAMHLRIIVQKIQTCALRSRRPLEFWERREAARCLLRILKEVVDRCEDLPPTHAPKLDRNLYINLIGDRDHNFAIGALNSLSPDAIHPLADDLSQTIDNMSTHGVPATYVEKLREIHQRARKARVLNSTLGSKRHRGGQGGRAKRAR